MTLAAIILPHMAMVTSSAMTPFNECVLPTDTITKSGKTLLSADTIPQNDSVTRLLPGVEVEADNYHYSGNKVVYRPTRNEKNASTDAIDLLERMKIPQLSATPEGITTFNGQEVSYFVNGHPASDEELKGMYMKNVKTVEYLEYPADPKYLGKPFVVDFRLQEYEYGGYTKIRVDNSAIGMFKNEEMLFSKFAYKRMIFDLSSNPYYIKRKNSMTASREIFHQDGDAIVRKSTPEQSKHSTISIPVKFRAAYSHGKTYLSNTFGFKYSDIQKSSNGSISYSSSDNQDYDYSSSRPYKILSATWDGYYSRSSDNGWSLSSQDHLYYTHNSINDVYETTMPVLINNRIKENSFSGKINFNLSKSFNDRHSIFAEVDGLLYTSHADYTGSNLHTNKFHKLFSSFEFGYQYRTKKFTAYSHAGVAYEKHKDNDDVVNTVYPFAVVSLNYNPNRKHRFSFWTQYSVFSCGASMQNATLIRLNDLMYVKGNPDIHPFGRWEINGTYNWNPIPKVLYFTGAAGYEYRPDRYITVYKPMPDSKAVIRTYENRGNSQLTFVNLGLGLFLLNDHLSFQVAQKFNFYRPSEAYLPNINNRYGHYSVDAYWKNFSFRADYFGNGKVYEDRLMESIIKKHTSYKFTFGYGNGDWTVSLILWNIFNSSWKVSESWVYSPIYESYDINYGTAYRQHFQIKLSYTFGYGKTIKRNNQLSSDVSSAGSSVNH